MRFTGLTRLAPIRRQVKRSRARCKRDEYSRPADPPPGAFGRCAVQGYPAGRPAANPEAFGSTFEKESALPLSWFEAVLDGTAIFGAFIEGTLGGVAAYAAQEGAKHAHRATLWGMYVRDTARNLGLGKKLVAAVLDHARGRVEMVQLTVVSENEGARRVYSAAGFVEYGYEKRGLKYGGRYYDQVLMVKFLDEGLN